MTYLVDTVADARDQCPLTPPYPPAAWLVVAQRPLEDTRTVEPQGSPDTTAQDNYYYYYFSLIGMPAGELAAPLARRIGARHQSGRLY